jgi:hypothetical protein
MPPSKRRAPDSSKAGVSADGAVVTIDEGWRTLYLPTFTIGSMTYGAANASGAAASTNEDALSATSEGRQASSGDVAYDKVLDTLVAPHDESERLVKLNPWIYSVLAAMTFNAYFVVRNEPERLRIMNEKEVAFEVIIGWIVRLFNMKCWVLPIIVLSLWFLRSNASKGIWNVGSHLRLLYTKETTERIAFDLGSKIQTPSRFPAWASRKILLCVFDNCLVKFPTSYEGCRELGDGSWQYLFINWFVRPIASEDVPDDFNPSITGKLAYFLLFRLPKFYHFSIFTKKTCPKVLSHQELRHTRRQNG